MRVTALHCTPTVHAEPGQYWSQHRHGHSVRSATTSAAANAGKINSDILKATDWSSEFSFPPDNKGTRILSKYITTAISCQRQCSARTILCYIFTNINDYNAHYKKAEE